MRLSSSFRSLHSPIDFLLACMTPSGFAAKMIRTAGRTLAALAVMVLASTVIASAQTAVVVGSPISFATPAGQTVESIAGDASGNLFLAANNGVYEVKAGTTTLKQVFDNPALFIAVATDGSIYTADSVGEVYKTLPGGTPVLFYTDPNQNFSGIALDGKNNLYLADQTGVSEAPAGTTSFSSSGTGTFVRSFAVDSAGDIFVAGQPSNSYVQVYPQSGSYPATLFSAQNTSIGSIAADSAGNVYAVSSSSSAAYEYVKATGVEELLPTFNNGQFVTSSVPGQFFVSDEVDNLIYEVQSPSTNLGKVNVCPAGQTSAAPCSASAQIDFAVTGSGTFGASKALTQGAPNLDFTVSKDGCSGAQTMDTECQVTVTFAPLAPGARLGAVNLTDTGGSVLATAYVSGTGVGPAVAFFPAAPSNTYPPPGDDASLGVAVDQQGNLFVVNDDGAGNAEIDEIMAGSTQAKLLVSNVAGGGAVALAIDGAGNLLIPNEDGTDVLKIPPGCSDASCGTTIGSGFQNLVGVAVDGAGDIFVTDVVANTLTELPVGCTTSNCQVTIASGFNSPAAVAVDSANNLFVADTLNSRVIKIPNGCTTSGCQVTIGANFSYPEGVAVDAAGNVFISDTDDYRVVEVPVGCGDDSCQIVLAGNLNGGPALLAVDQTGNVFIVVGSRGVIEAARSQAPTLTFASTAVNATSSDSPMSVQIQNIGNQPLTSSAPGVSVGNNFALVSGSGTPADCTSSFSLTAGAICNLSISFEPQEAGSISSAAVLKDNGLNASPSATQSIPLAGTGTQTTQTISFTANAPAAAAFGSNFTVAASATSGLPVAFTSSGACTNSGAKYTMTSGAGTCSVIANQAGNSSYSAASQMTESTSATPASQTITFTTNAPASAGDGSSFTVAATAGSGLAVTFTSSGACTNSGAKYTMTAGAGTCSVIANQAGSSNYSAAPNATESVTASKVSVPTPVFKASTGTFTTTNTITISDALAGTTIYYTMNGKTPTASSTKYTGPITISSDETIKAIAYKTSETQSAVATASYTITKTVPAPTFTPAAGKYTKAQSVTIKDLTIGVTIYYTTNGSTPTTSSTRYTGAISVSSTKTIKALGVASGYGNSAIASASYTIAP